MATSVGSIEYDASINLKQLKSDAREVDKIANDTGDSLDKGIARGSGKAGSSLKGLSGTLLSVAATITTVIGVTNILGDAFSSLAGLETARSGFEVLTGSAERASQVMGEIADYANNTPFEFPEVAKSARTLLGFGVRAEDVSGTIKQLGDAVAASGAEFSGVSRVFGQIFAAGKLNAEDFNQLIDNGIALGPEISKELGIPISELKDKIADGAVTTDVFQKALSAATSEGGKFFGATDKLAGTLNGRLSTLQDTFTGFVGTIIGVDFKTGLVDANGAFATFSNTVAEVTNFLNNDGKRIFNDTIKFVTDLATQVGTYLGPKFSTLGDTLQKEVIPLINQLWKEVIEPFLPVLGTALVGAIGGVVDALTFVIDGISGLIKAFNEGNPVVVGLTGVFGALALAMAFDSTFSALNAGFGILTNTTIPGVAAKVTGLQALIASPIGFGAISITAALIALYEVKKAADEAFAAINNAKKQIDANSQLTKDQIARNAKIQAGPYSEIEKEKSRKLTESFLAIDAQGRANGGPVFSGGMYAVGDNPDGSWNKTTELFVPGKSGSIINSKDLQAAMGAGGSSISYQIGSITIGSEVDGQRWIQKLTKHQDIVSKGLTPSMGI